MRAVSVGAAALALSVALAPVGASVAPETPDALAPVGASAAPVTFGTGFIGQVSTQPVQIFNHTVAGKGALGVMTYFWTTGSSDIDAIWLDYYVDGEANASISFQPSMACGQGYPSEQQASLAPQGVFQAGAKAGKSAVVGGWFHYYKIPFQRSIVVQARTAAGATHAYINVRGHESLAALTLESGFQLPPTARMRLHRIENVTYAPLSFVPLLTAPTGSAGLLYQLTFATSTVPAGNNYIEGCWHFYRTASEAFPGMVLGTGVEDLFSSAYWFCQVTGGKPCIFSHPNSGLLYFGRDYRERLSAYRFFDSEVVGFSDGGRLEWRVGDVKDKCTSNATAPVIGKPEAVAVRAYVWAYEW